MGSTGKNKFLPPMSPVMRSVQKVFCQHFWYKGEIVILCFYCLLSSVICPLLGAKSLFAPDSVIPVVKSFGDSNARILFLRSGELPPPFLRPPARVGGELSEAYCRRSGGRWALLHHVVAPAKRQDLADASGAPGD
jgi:hypothetical protein